MVLYLLEDVNALLSPNQKNYARPTFGSLWHLAQQFYNALQKLDHADHPTDGWSGYLMTPEEFALCSATAWTHPEDVGKFFVIPITAISMGHQEQAKGGVQVQEGNLRLIRCHCNGPKSYIRAGD